MSWMLYRKKFERWLAREIGMFIAGFLLGLYFCRMFLVTPELVREDVRNMTRVLKQGALPGAGDDAR